MGTVRNTNNPTLQDRLDLRDRPRTSVVMYQRWSDLLFLHWDWDPAEIQKTLPSGLHVDTHDGRCLLGVVPFKMRRIRPRFLPVVPGISDFLELNVRTYVHDEAGRPGVWFYSLDADQRLAVALGKRFFSLPYRPAKMHCIGDSEKEEIRYSSRRIGDTTPEIEFRYRAFELPFKAQPGSLEFFLLERYLLFARTRDGLRSGRVHHAPYPVRRVELTEWDEQPLAVNHFTPPRRSPDHAVMSPGVDVEVFGLQVGR